MTNNNIEVRFEKNMGDKPLRPLMQLHHDDNEDDFFFGSAISLTNAQIMAEENEAKKVDITQRLEPYLKDLAKAAVFVYSSKCLDRTKDFFPLRVSSGPPFRRPTISVHILLLLLLLPMTQTFMSLKVPRRFYLPLKHESHLFPT